MNLLVKNEADIVRDNIEFHLAHGVDYIIATDNNSSDGTKEILLEYEIKGVLHMISENGTDFDCTTWNNNMARLAYERFQADIVFRNDADEFWHPQSGNLKDCFKVHENDAILEIERISVLLENSRGTESFPQNTRFAVTNPITTQDVSGVKVESKNQNFYLYRLRPKLAIRTSKIGNIELPRGNHSISNEGNFDIKRISNIRIYHFPIRSKKQFNQRVVRNGLGVLNNTSAQSDEGFSWHIKRMYQSLIDGKLDEEYKLLTITYDERD